MPRMALTYIQSDHFKTLHVPRIEIVALKRETMLGRCLAWFGIYFTHGFEYKVKVNLQTKEVVMYRYH